MRVMTITALHCAFQHLVMEGQIKLVLHLGVAAQAKLWLTVFQKFDGREARLFGVCRRYESDRAGNILSAGAAMGGVAICTTYVVAPVFTAPEVIVLLSSGVTCKTRLGCFFGGLVFEGNDLGRIAFFHVRSAGTMTRLAPSHFPLPTANG